MPIKDVAPPILYTDTINHHTRGITILMQRILRFSLIITALLALMAAMWAGLLRLGLDLPPLDANLPILHGPLMINGFLGLVIGLERAVALVARRTYWPYLSPLCLAVGCVVVFFSPQAGALLITLGSFILVVVFGLIIHHQRTLFTLTMGGGALSWLIGNVLWLSGQPVYSLVLWWMGFPLLTVIGERLELSRIQRLTPTSYRTFALMCLIFIAGALVSLFNLDLGMRLAGLGELACALWLFRYDIARRTLRKPGMPQFIALCLLSGYAWLGISGLLNLGYGATYAGPYYDAALHSLFVGFVLSMIFGHALLILPAVLSLPIRFHPQLYVSLGLLHASLILRIVGDLALLPEVRQWGGLLNEIALLIFLGSMVYTVISARGLRPQGS